MRRIRRLPDAMRRSAKLLRPGSYLYETSTETWVTDRVSSCRRSLKLFYEAACEDNSAYCSTFDSFSASYLLSDFLFVSFYSNMYSVRRAISSIWQRSAGIANREASLIFTHTAGGSEATLIRSQSNHGKSVVKERAVQGVKRDRSTDLAAAATMELDKVEVPALTATITVHA